MRRLMGFKLLSLVVILTLLISIPALGSTKSKDKKDIGYKIISTYKTWNEKVNIFLFGENYKKTIRKFQIQTYIKK